MSTASKSTASELAHSAVPQALLMLPTVKKFLGAASVRFFPLLAALRPVAKWAVILLFLLNFRSWPLQWHFRVFRPVFRIRIQHKLLEWRTLFYSRKARRGAEDKWLDSITPIGADPFTYEITYKSWASIDDSDFNGHLSNSSYPKTLDAARFKTALEMFPMFFRCGGWIPLAGTHFNFVREIPMFASYEVRITTGSWDNKWIYVISKFVSKPKSKKTKKVPTITANGTPKDADSSPSASGDELFHASLRTPSTDVLLTSPSPTPLPSTTPSTTSSPNPSADQAQALKAVTDTLIASTSRTGGIEPDGAILHTVTVSQCCFKVGRITVPPSLVMAMNGFSAPSPQSGVPAYSSGNPPPHWKKAKELMSFPYGGSPKKMKEFMKGGWKNVPEGERWWEEAFVGVEEQRVRRMEVVGKIGQTMGELRSF